MQDDNGFKLSKVGDEKRQMKPSPRFSMPRKKKANQSMSTAPENNLEKQEEQETPKPWSSNGTTRQVTKHEFKKLEVDDEQRQSVDSTSKPADAI